MKAHSSEHRNLRPGEEVVVTGRQIWRVGWIREQYPPPLCRSCSSYARGVEAFIVLLNKWQCSTSLMFFNYSLSKRPQKQIRIMICIHCSTYCLIIDYYYSLSYITVLMNQISLWKFAQFPDVHAKWKVFFPKAHVFASKERRLQQMEIGNDRAWTAISPSIFLRFQGNAYRNLLDFFTYSDEYSFPVWTSPKRFCWWGIFPAWWCTPSH